MPEFEVTKTVVLTRRIEAEDRSRAKREMERAPMHWPEADITVEAEEVEG